MVGRWLLAVGPPVPRHLPFFDVMNDESDALREISLEQEEASSGDRGRYKRQAKSKSTFSITPRPALSEKWGSFLTTVMDNCLGLRGFYQIIIKKEAMLADVHGALRSRAAEDAFFELVARDLVHISGNALQWGGHMRISSSMFIFRVCLLQLRAPLQSPVGGKVISCSLIG